MKATLANSHIFGQATGPWPYVTHLVVILVVELRERDETIVFFGSLYECASKLGQDETAQTKSNEEAPWFYNSRNWR
jgi:hypothetical protein